MKYLSLIVKMFCFSILRIKITPKKNQKQAGFSLTEIVVAMAVVGILFSLAVPNWQKAIEHQRLIEAVEQIELDLYDSFSNARNLNQTTQFLVIKRGNNFYSINTNNAQKISLPTGIRFTTEAQFTFVPPYGNIEPIPRNTEIWIQNNHQKTGLKIYPQSGLIERLSIENL